jgi:hypothetical protein
MRPIEHAVAPLLGVGPDKIIETESDVLSPQAIDYPVSEMVNRLLIYDFLARIVLSIAKMTATCKSIHTP